MPSISSSKSRAFAKSASFKSEFSFNFVKAPTFSTALVFNSTILFRSLVVFSLIKVSTSLIFSLIFSPKVPSKSCCIIFKKFEVLQVLLLKLSISLNNAFISILTLRALSNSILCSVSSFKSKFLRFLVIRSSGIFFAILLIFSTKLCLCFKHS